MIVFVEENCLIVGLVRGFVCSGCCEESYWENFMCVFVVVYFFIIIVIVFVFMVFFIVFCVDVVGFVDFCLWEEGNFC